MFEFNKRTALVQLLHGDPHDTLVHVRAHFQQFEATWKNDESAPVVRRISLNRAFTYAERVVKGTNLEIDFLPEEGLLLLQVYARALQVKDFGNKVGMHEVMRTVVANLFDLLKQMEAADPPLPSISRVVNGRKVIFPKEAPLLLAKGVIVELDAWGHRCFKEAVHEAIIFAYAEELYRFCDRRYMDPKDPVRELVAVALRSNLARPSPAIEAAKKHQPDLTT